MGTFMQFLALFRAHFLVLIFSVCSAGVQLAPDLLKLSQEDIGRQDHEGRTILHRLALDFEKSRDANIFDKKLKNICLRKADLCKQDNCGKLALDYLLETVDLISVENEKLPIVVQELRKYRALHNPLQTSRAIGRNILHVMAAFMCAGQRIYDIGEYNRSIYELIFNLFVATYEPHVNARDDSGNTPLHCAVAANNLFIVDKLLNEKKIFHFLQDSDEQTPLHLAIRLNHANIALELIDQNDRINSIKDRYGRTVLHYAVKFAGSEIFNEVIQYADKELINTKDHRGRTAIDYANKQWQFRRAAMLKKRAK